MTGSFRGKVNKTARVYSNDPQNKLTTISIRAFIKVPIYLSSKYIYFSGQSGVTITKTIKIKGKKDRPLELEPIYFDLYNKVTYKIKHVGGKKTYQIYFTNIACPPQTFHGTLKLKTNYPEEPKITIRIRGRFIKGIQTHKIIRNKKKPSITLN